MNVLISEDLRELAAHWAYVLIEDRRLSADGIDRVIAALREECEVMLARNSPEHGDGPVSPRWSGRRTPHLSLKVRHE